MSQDDVIAAIATPLAPCPRIIVRISGRKTWRVVQSLLASGEVKAGVSRLHLTVEGMSVPALAICYPEGHGYTTEESAELHLPGNPLLAQMVLEALYEAGARPAEPGEFTARAFLHGRLDLTEAEGVAATIHSTNQRELDAARRLQSGELTRRLRPVVDALVETLALVEAGIDFAEEDIRFITTPELLERVATASHVLDELMEGSARLESLSHEPTIVLCGRPNAGKSTLLNALARKQRAIVSPMPGTTRDLLSAEIELPRGMVRMIDTAGLEQSCPVAGSIQRQMQERAMQAVERADVLVLVVERGDAAMAISRQPDLVVMSKCDLGAVAGQFCVSALTGQGLDDLRTRLDELAFASTAGEVLALNARHIRQIGIALQELAQLKQAQDLTGELVAEHLRYAVDALGEISGVVSPEDVLAKIFSGFCIGK